MKKLIIPLFLAIIHGCDFCPDPIHVEYNSVNKTITVLSEDYYIKTTTISEYIPGEESLLVADSNKVVINQMGARGTKILNITKSGEHYITTVNNNSKDLFSKENLKFEIELEKFENKKGKGFNKEKIEFFTIKGEVITHHTHKYPCP